MRLYNKAKYLRNKCPSITSLLHKYHILFIYFKNNKAKYSFIVYIPNYEYAMFHVWNTRSFYTEKYPIDSNNQKICTDHLAFDQPHVERFRHICNAQGPFQ